MRLSLYLVAASLVAFPLLYAAEDLLRQTLPVSAETTPSNSPAYTEMEDFMRPYRAQLEEEWGSVVCSSAAAMPKYSQELRDFITSAVRLQYNRLAPDTPVDVFFMKASIFRSSLSEGDLTRRHFAEFMPTDYTLVTFEATGRELLPLLEFLLEADGSYPFSNARITRTAEEINATIGGEPLDMSKTYRFATDDYLASGILPLLKDYPEKDDTGLLIRDLIIGHARTLSDAGQQIQP